MYASIKKGLGVRLAAEKQFPYYPTRYFRRQVADWLVTNRQKVMLVKGDYLREAYGVHVEGAHPGPFSYKEYCRRVLDRNFWGDALILYAVSCMWAVRITVINSKTLQQYKVRHTAGLRDADLALVYNASSHYTAAGKGFQIIFLYKRQVACNVVSCSVWSLVYVACFLRSLVVACNCKWSLAVYIEWSPCSSAFSTGRPRSDKRCAHLQASGVLHIQVPSSRRY